MFRGSTLAASEWPAEKREGCTQAVDPLRVDKTEREGEGGREGTSQVVVSTHPLSEMANRWRPPRSWYRRIIRFVTRYRTTLAVYLSTRETRVWENIGLKATVYIFADTDSTELKRNEYRSTEREYFIPKTI